MSVLIVNTGSLAMARVYKQPVDAFLREQIKLRPDADTLVIRCDRDQLAREDVTRLSAVFDTFTAILHESKSAPSPKPA